MADVSVRFQVAGDSEIVLNLATAEAVRLVEAIMRKVAESMGSPSMGSQSMGSPSMGAQQRPPVGSAWSDSPPAAPGMSPGR
ncbi:hypothetical protein [Frankia sp. AgKG'84/4]|uniref:hypothetical protein n=1 Tax=Frankia sp. AgKG'84/4 TaxID=573490 RepID=UPI00200CEA01|nr:hypothetical protein [Frankia sp. AgKG'84/4]MCL9794966.1 hypothetical protein [Frankia sp. AgKG'84/4]